MVNLNRLKKGKNGAITLSKADINEMERRLKQAEDELKQTTTSVTILLVLAYLMEEPEFNYSGEKLVEMFEKISVWSENIKEHMISVKAIAKIVEEKTGMVVEWK